MHTHTYTHTCTQKCTHKCIHTITNPNNMQRVRCHSHLSPSSFSRSFFCLSLSQQTPPLPPPSFLSRTPWLFTSNRASNEEYERHGARCEMRNRLRSVCEMRNSAQEAARVLVIRRVRVHKGVLCAWTQCTGFFHGSLFIGIVLFGIF